MSNTMVDVCIVVNLDQERRRWLKSKYGWEICDEVQRFVSNIADVAFVQRCEYDKLLEANKVMRDALETIKHSRCVDCVCDVEASEALAKCEIIMKGESDK